MAEMDDRLLSKVRKLLTLAGNAGATESEASNAAAAAQRLIEMHRLDIGDLTDAPEPLPEPVEPVEQHVLDPEDQSRKIINWRVKLAGGIARANGCRLYTTGPRIKMIGQASRVTAVRYLYAYLSREVDRLGTQAGAGMGRGYGNAFRVGCAERISERLREAAAAGRIEAQAAARLSANATGGVAIVRLENRLERLQADKVAVDAFYDKMRWGPARKASSVRSSSGYHAGRAAGDRVRLSSGPALGAGSSRLKG